MFILNKKSKVIQECHNKDVIKVCMKDTNNYAVASTRAELEGTEEPQREPEANMVEENIIEEQENASESLSVSEESNSDEAKEGWKALPEDEKLAALEAKKVDDLRKIAKEEGIQGYSNMSKDTLVAMIMNH